MFHHVSSKQLIFIQTWGTRKSNGLFVSGFPLLVFFSSDVRYTMVYLISGQSQVKSMLLTYCAPHCVGSGFCVGSACLTVVTLSETKSTNYIYIYHHISHIITYIYNSIYIYTTKSSNRPNRHRIWCLCCSCCCSMCCRCRSSSICCCICCFAISGSGLCICNWMVATFPEAVRDGTSPKRYNCASRSCDLHTAWNYTILYMLIYVWLIIVIHIVFQLPHFDDWRVES